MHVHTHVDATRDIVLKRQVSEACWETIEMSHSDTDSEKSGSDLESEHATSN